jgi:hypothetical protein
MFVLVLIQVKRNERDILEGIKQIKSGIIEGKYTRVSKQCTVFEISSFFSNASAQSVFLCWI